VEATLRDEPPRDEPRRRGTLVRVKIRMRRNDFS
jgi:hypothetical protein